MTTAAQHPADVRVIPEWDLADKLAKALRHVGMGPGELAAILGVNPTTVSRWLGGQSEPNRATLMILADLTGVELAWLEESAKRARRDSNPKPSVLVLVPSEPASSVRPVLTPKLGTVGHRLRVLRSVS